MAKSSKRTHSKGNSLPPANNTTDNTMADDDFEELQRCVSEENIILHHFSSHYSKLPILHLRSLGYAFSMIQ